MKTIACIATALALALPLSACNTWGGVKQDAKEVGQAAGRGVEKAGVATGRGIEKAGEKIQEISK
ncbi:MAG: entericidin EcnAB [Hydrogenophaga sp.]|nr:entericidin EcnAB [Hydrogenophaga sp.]